MVTTTEPQVSTEEAVRYVCSAGHESAEHAGPLYECRHCRTLYTKNTLEGARPRQCPTCSKNGKRKQPHQVACLVCGRPVEHPFDTAKGDVSPSTVSDPESPVVEMAPMNVPESPPAEPMLEPEPEAPVEVVDEAAMPDPDTWVPAGVVDEAPMPDPAPQAPAEVVEVAPIPEPEPAEPMPEPEPEPVPVGVVDEVDTDWMIRDVMTVRCHFGKADIGTPERDEAYSSLVYLLKSTGLARSLVAVLPEGHESCTVDWCFLQEVDPAQEVMAA